MNILITGGAGFIGSSLAKSLLRDGHDITIMDNFSTGKISNIIDIINNIKLVNIDLSNIDCFSSVEYYISNADVIYHFAASIGVKLIQEKFKESLHNNVNINNNLFPLFEKYNKKVIFSSTSEVYGETKSSYGSTETDKLEIYPTQKPRGSYACSKLMSEFMLKAYNFPSVIVRFFNIVGPTQLPDHGHVLPRFIDSIKHGKKLTIYGDGTQIRSYCDIRDAVNMLKLLIDNIHDGEIYNIGNGDINNRCSVNELAYVCVEIFKSTSSFEYVSFDDALGKQFEEIYVRYPNTEKIEQYYKCKHSLADIIENIQKEV